MAATLAAPERLGCRAARAGAVVVALALSAAPALAQGPSGSSKTEAHAHFTRGLEAASLGRWHLAAWEFERAYEIAPHYSVLYNLGVVYSSLGRGAAAARALERYLGESDARIDPSRRAEVQKRLADITRDLARLRVVVEPVDAELQLDARALEPSEISAGFALDPGAHVVIARREGYRTESRTIRLGPGETSELSIVLEPEPRAAADPLVAVFVSCAVPDVALTVDGNATPWPSANAPLSLPAGARVVAFTRPGYRQDEQRVRIAGGERLRCALRPLPGLSRAESARLDVRAPRGAIVEVDDAAFTGARLPSGRHHVVVRHPDYRSWAQTVLLPPGSEVVVEPDVTFTIEKQRRDEQASQRRTWAYAAGITGAGLIAAGAVTYVVNGARYDELQSDNEELARDAASSPGAAPAQTRRFLELQERAASIQRVDDLALGVAAAGVVALGVGVGLYVSAESGGEATGKTADRERTASLGVRGVW